MKNGASRENDQRFRLVVQSVFLPINRSRLKVYSLEVKRSS